MSAQAAAALSALTRQAEGIWQAVAPLLPGFSVEVLAEIDSTNSELMRRGREGVQAPVLLVAAQQTAGRGRLGRAWTSLAGDSLTFSLGLPLQPQNWSGLSLLVGLSLAEQLHPDVRLKWPNDLWWQDRKLGGILVETASQADQRWTVVGVGLNLATPTLPLAEGAALTAQPPTGLRALDATAADRDAGQWLAALLPRLVHDLLHFERSGFGPWAERFQARDALQGRPVRLSDGRQGVAQGVAADGSLRLQTPDGLQLVHSGEVSVRPC
jgi:BirA family transcriptional regulator, biotin operon repressor / biotin---[acetyl-CoA-carboxylase] ligase